MFTLYNENFNAIPLPLDQWGYGLKELDFNISSVNEEITEHVLNGVPGTIITGHRDNSREASLRVVLKAENTKDFRVKRDQVFAFFKRLGDFYVSENFQDYKVLRVRVVDSYTIDRPDNNRVFAVVEIPLKVVGQPYWISRHKSLSLPSEVAFDLGVEAEYQHSNKESFTIFNAGTVPLKTIQEKDNCIIIIEVKQSVTNFRLYDGTGRYFEYNPNKVSNWALASGNKIVLNGHSIKMNNTPIIERTNRYFLNILPGENMFTVEGLTSYSASFDFRFKFD